MNDPSALAHIAESFEHRSATDTRLHGRRLVLCWIGWVLLGAYTLGVFFGSLPFYFAHLQTICTRTPCITGQALASTVMFLHGLGFSLSSYALLMLVLIYGILRLLVFIGLSSWVLPVWGIGFLAALPLGFLIAVRIGHFLLGRRIAERNV